MGKVVTITSEHFGVFKNFKMVKALQTRLHDLLYKQNALGQTLTVKERKEAEVLVDLAQMLTLLKLKIRVAEKISKA